MPRTSQSRSGPGLRARIFTQGAPIDRRRRSRQSPVPFEPRESGAPDKQEPPMTPSDSITRNAVPDGSNESQTPLTVTVNGTQVRTIVADRLLLSDFLRDQLGLTALKVACGEGAC